MTCRKSSTWAVVLAAGEGSRLRDLTTSADGIPIPKQFCSLFGERSLLEDALARAAEIVPADRICTIVAQQHRQWWSTNKGVRTLRSRNVFVQPANRGTAIGILYSLLHVLNKDPDARVVFLPSDHYVSLPDKLSLALHAASERVERIPGQIVLLGMEPEEADAELGYILPGAVDPDGGWTVARFIEKPATAHAREIIAQEGLWNTFIFAASARTLLHLFVARFAAVVVDMQLGLSRYLTASRRDLTRLVDLYEKMPHLDFSRDILEAQPTPLCVLRVPACGWSDLGTPKRLGQTLNAVGAHHRTHMADCSASPNDYLSLALQYRRLGPPQQLTSYGHV